MNDRLSLLWPDGSSTEIVAGATVAEALGARANAETWGAVVNNRLFDLQTAIREGGAIRPVAATDPEALDLIRHTTAHVMAQAVREIHPDALFAIGPVIENGYFYDIDLSTALSLEEFEKFESIMRRIVAGKHPMTRRAVSRSEALAYFQSDKYKVELIENLPSDAEITTYTQDTFTDLCRGPHAPHTGCIGAFKLQKLAGAYWRGDSRNPMLQRIYGTAWKTKAELDEHIKRLEEAAKRDHRVIGKALDLFHISEEAPGSVFWHPRGWAIWRVLEDYIRELLGRNGYQEVKGPQILDRSLWERSGHWEKFRENMFTTETEGREFAVKPMNCPGHVLIFNARQHSYRELPLRLAEFGSCHRNEPSGTLHGIFRIRAFVQDDAHIFCTEEQIGSEVEAFVRMLQGVYRDFGFPDVIVKLATRPEKRIGADEVWDRAEKALEDAVKRIGLECRINPGEGAFYGPKIEFSVPDAIGRVWQLGTIQVDFSMPERLGAEYVGEDNAKHIPVMLHRAILGSLERFIGILIENYAGAFPLWLAPEQARVMSITDAQAPAVQEIEKKLQEAGFRVAADTRSEKINRKIRDAQIEKIPYMLVVGGREAASGAVAVRHRKDGDLGAMPLEAWIARAREEIAGRK